MYLEQEEKHEKGEVTMKDMVNVWQKQVEFLHSFVFSSLPLKSSEVENMEKRNSVYKRELKPKIGEQMIEMHVTVIWAPVWVISILR